MYSLAAILFFIVTYQKKQKKYGITQVPFNGKWWHYYERGLSFEEGGLWKEAEADFRTAISKRNNDSNFARTYGRHWISINNKPGYFPQRELGIVLYRQDFIEQAIDMLEASIKTQASTRAKIYLNRARKKFIKKNQSDVSNPYIEIYSPQNSSWTNDSLICIEGIVKDDTFVQSIQVDNKDIYIDQSNERIRFNMQKTLIEGKNIISIIAHDLSGKQSIKNITINVDYIGPSIHIENIQKTQSELICKGSIFDNSGIVKVTINEVEHICSNKKNFSFIKRFSLKKNVFSIDISAIDLAGNKTSANIPFFPDNNTSSKKKLLAYNGNSEINNMMIFALTNNISQNDNKSPEIILKKI
ncbi:MAG: hypothetical protein OMM_10171 [Candidatus Magnetoglobus multicellularis str. Araruama]|uniref:Uncharacterized protein n=1 Tax=Candidatus Magnetoglobus multicellularis str. Araruama TaxID=890399 RepID=A0A1V1P1P0_9BACT|nr:MAG: hypothetical protein OMM_10171 [Candidatus Magnetoglobus multicellularis str. Araruama]